MISPRVDDDRLKRDEALLQTILIHGVPVRTVAWAIGVSRQTIYRRMQRAKVNLRRAAERHRKADPGDDG